MNTIISKPTIGTQNPIDRQIASSYRSAFSSHAEKLGSFILRYGLVAILLYFGAYKFTTEEAQGIAPLVAHSPLFNWLQASFGTQGISNLIGSSEIVIALLIATRPFSARLSSIGSTSLRWEPSSPLYASYWALTRSQGSTNGAACFVPE